MPTDWELLQRYREGQVAALEALVDRHRRPLYGFILNMVHNPVEADEVFQEVWLRAIRKLETYWQKNFAGWLMRIAHNLVVDQIRKHKPIYCLDQPPAEGGETPRDRIAAATPDPAEQALRRELRERVARAVDTLPTEQKAVFLLRVEADLPFKDIAEIQEVSINTALARMQYALTKLRTLLKEDYALLTAQGG